MVEEASDGAIRIMRCGGRGSSLGVGVKVLVPVPIKFKAFWFQHLELHVHVGILWGTICCTEMTMKTSSYLCPVRLSQKVVAPSLPMVATQL